MPTLIEVAKDSSTQLEANVLRTITERSPIMERVPFITVSGMQYAFNRERSLPTVATRNIGGTYTANSGVIEQVNEPLRIYGGEVKIDNFEVKQGGNVRDAKNRQFRMKARAMALTFSQDFLEGDGDLNPAGIDGLRNRITASTQLLDAGSGGDTLTLDDLDRLADSVVGGATAFIMNITMRRKITALARDHSGHPLLDVQTSALGKQVMAYAGVPILIIERDDDASTLLEFNENDGSGNLDTCSIYAVRWGEDYVCGLKGSGTGMDVKDFGELESAPQHMGRIEAYWGLKIGHPRSASRLYHINNA